MLILNINEGSETLKKEKGIFRKKIVMKKTEEIKRYSIDINGKFATVLELPEKQLENEDVLKLLKIYKGRVLVSEKYVENALLKPYLFAPKEYYQRAVLSSLKNQIRTVNKDWKNICIKIDKFSPFREIFELVKISKTVTLITKSNFDTDKFLNDCYHEFGAIVYVIEEDVFFKYDIYLDLDEVDDSGKLMVNVKNRNFLLYPDSSYFADKEEYKKLLPFNIEHNIICAINNLT